MENRKSVFCRRWRRTASLTTPRSDSPSICENGLSTINLWTITKYLWVIKKERRSNCAHDEYKYRKKKRTFSINKEILAKLDVISESKGIQNLNL